MNSPARTIRQWQPSPSEADSDYIDLRRIWNAIWMRKWAIVLFVVVITLVTALAVSRMTPVYRAVSTVMIETKGTQLVSFQQVYDTTGAVNEYLQTQLGLIKSRGVAEKVVRELNLTEHPDFDPRQQPKPLINVGGFVRSVQGMLSVTGLVDEPEPATPMTEAELLDIVTKMLMDRTSIWVEGKSQLVSISVELPDRLTAAQIANSLASNYIDSQLEAQMEMSLSATTWMNTRLTELRSSLQEAENRLQAYREAEGLVDVNGVATISNNELSLTGDRMIDARRQRAEAESQFRQVESMGSTDWRRLSSVPAVLGNPLIQQFKAEEARARAKVEELSRRYGERHPAMAAAKSDLSAASASLRAQVEQVVASIERNYQLAVANENSLNASFNKNKEQIQDISRKEFKVRELTRDVESNRSLYETFMTRLRETAATQDVNSSNARIIDQAIAPIQAAAPNKKLLIVLAAGLALIFGIALAVIRDILNNTFKSADDVENKLNLPVLGIVPLISTNTKYTAAHLFEHGEDARFCESIRTIRTSLMLADTSRSQKVLVVTSSSPGEGKSTLVANMAFALSQLQRVLLIDADLRRPTLAKSFDFPVGTPGLANLITGSAKVEDCIHNMGNNLDMLPAGAVPPNPLELLASPRFAKFLEMIKERYDHIIIDSPPSQAVSDASLLSTFADSVIYVIKSEATSIPLAQRGVGHLLQSGASVMGVVLNQVDVEKAARSGDYSGYYDHYGYSDRKA
ncbi:MULTISPECIES: polysaccharide biosynthesis tyrosine autokinase [Pseudomonas]|uniref:non-specific protein-tyrosine kinase n=2 Tax=Pseudomonadaceae TaxID=135621 RepID=A0A0D0JNH8_9PSED|nr:MULTISPECIES: polysaccharide biosynthesis tyrosine autokinase [Pseudomonas]KIP87849.1 lipopolysaccharide biosynthesis protein [Pseudomonas fulva]MCW2293466.1 capsular exopolysaccharide synthesis family protein [Pseudomonas sp. BIGb0408]NYH71963.1 capsular exopolysaccharide synthesis family protein [Pseudomonas flavescens]